ncbi:CAP domain-containing protein [Nonomuraea sp. C10]|uniref:CAP domain-containing protein n=1 Tax=Nonomuraea sp. C10 TaxID=2600577 RepID=UPI001C9D30DD|nr:CAP domain-containing protein [Nonomuraea sp. C10]
MRRRLQALACLGSLAATGIPASSPAAAQTAYTAQAVGTAAGAAVPTMAACRVVAARPALDPGGTITATAVRTGCDDESLLRLRIREAGPGPDRTLGSDSRVLVNGRVTVRLRCSPAPRRYYVTAMDFEGRPAMSRSVVLSCGYGPGSGSDASAAEAAVVRLTNQARAGRGCRPLLHDRRLHRAAERHSADMAARGYFDHTGRDGRSGGDRIRAAGFAPLRGWGENIAVGPHSAAQVVRGWLDSPGHRRNIMDCSYTHIGVGQHPRGPHWTQTFASH